MSVLLQSCAGTIHVFRAGVSGGSGMGLFRLSPPIKTGDGTMCFIDSIPASAREIVQPVVTLDDKRFLFVFGAAWTEAAMTGRLLLGKDGTRGSQTAKFLNWYNEVRVSKRRAPIKASAGETPLLAYVSGMQLGDVDPHTYVQSFTINSVVNFDAQSK